MENQISINFDRKFYIFDRFAEKQFLYEKRNVCADRRIKIESPPLPASKKQSTLSNLPNIHAPLITKQSSHENNPWFTSYIQAFKTFRRHLEHVYKRTTDPASRTEALANLKSATHRYHKLVIAAKQKYYSSLIHSSSSNPRHLWRAVNSLLHRKYPSPLPTSIPSPSIADTFCSFFSDKI